MSNQPSAFSQPPPDDWWGSADNQPTAKPAPLNVGILLDHDTPSTWVHSALTRIHQNDDMALRLHVYGTAISVDTNSAGARGRSLLQHLTHWLLYRIADHPLFKDDVESPGSLQTALNTTSTETVAALSDCAVVLYLGSSYTTLIDITTQLPHTEIWHFGLWHLESRIQSALCSRAPFIWLHLWRSHAMSPCTKPTQSVGEHAGLPATAGHDQAHSSSEKQSCEAHGLCGERISSHALPCQSYSISDLRRLCYGALPAVIESRLNWLHQAHNQNLTFDALAIHQGWFDEDLQRAEADAKRYHATPTAEAVHDTGARQAIWSDTLAALQLVIKQTASRIHRRLYAERWEIAIMQVDKPQETTLQSLVGSRISDFTAIPQGNDPVRADPHIGHHDDHILVFFERITRTGSSGQIDCMTLDKDTCLSATPAVSQAVLKEDFHLSYPFVFEHQGCCYMVPETASRQCIMLYQSSSMQGPWTCDRTLIDHINAADTTVFMHDNHWWMFTNLMTHRCVDERDMLCLYFADTLHGPWTPHPLNPIVTGVDRSRMAGAVINDNGTLYRPSQYGAWRYGRGISVSRIDVLTPWDYRESPHLRLQPGPDEHWQGAHTLCVLDNHLIIDRLHYVRR